MIESAEEFIKLRISENPEEYHRAAHEPADIKVWRDVIKKYPDFKQWVINNKTIQLEVLEELAKDPDPNVRSCVAKKRKINSKIFDLLAKDKDEGVRYSLATNNKLTKAQLGQIDSNGSEWFEKELKRIKQRPTTE